MGFHAVLYLTFLFNSAQLETKLVIIADANLDCGFRAEWVKLKRTACVLSHRVLEHLAVDSTDIYSMYLEAPRP